jgi:hypothetical protein
MKPPNYAFKKGLHILIPYQKEQLLLRVPIKEELLWFEQLLNKGWKYSQVM